MSKGFFVLAILACGAWLLNGFVASTSPNQADELAKGRTLYNTYCASCHGIDASGNGPSAAKLKVTPPSLKELCMDGKFRDLYVNDYISGTVDDPSRTMPGFYEHFKKTEGKSAATLNIYVLTKYLEIKSPQRTTD